MNATPLVLLHGYPFDHTMWNRVLTALPALPQVLTPDLRGFGQTPATPDAEPSIDAMADDVFKLLEREQVPSAVVAGFSMGGYIALALAEQHRDRLAGLGLINSQPFADTEEARAGRRAMIEKVRREGPRAAVEGVLPKLFGAAHAQDPAFAGQVLAAAEQAGVAGITWALEAMARRPDRTAVLEQLNLPVLIAHSTEDQFIPVERARSLAERIPKVLYIEISGAGHCSPLEAPEIVAKGLAELIECC